MTNLDVLVAARSVIANKMNWVQGIRNIGNSYCALGALDTVVPHPESHPATEVLEAALHQNERAVAIRRLQEIFNQRQPVHSKSSIVGQFNNTHTHAEVIAAFDRAIERCRTVDSLTKEPVPVKVLEAV